MTEQMFAVKHCGEQMFGDGPKRRYNRPGEDEEVEDGRGERRAGEPAA